MPHIMLDIETLDTGPTAVVLSIGAVSFELNPEVPFQTIHQFYQRLEIQPQLDVGRTVSGSTLEWWMKQNTEARNDAFTGMAVHPTQALSEFTSFVSATSKLDLTDSIAGMWGNGSDFDNVIVGSLYDSFNLAKPWKFSRNRCYRTIKNMFPCREVTRMGTHHNALADAAHQAAQLQLICSTHRIK